jgi:hypothetical protein
MLYARGCLGIGVAGSYWARGMAETYLKESEGGDLGDSGLQSTSPTGPISLGRWVQSIDMRLGRMTAWIDTARRC